MDTCKHVAKVRVAQDHSILNPQKWLCVECGTTESVWACLSCSHVACGRYNQEHALKHYKDSKHPIALEVNEKYVYCYECDEYVLNDNAAGDIKLLRTTLSAIATQSFTDIESRGKRILRSHSFHGFETKSADQLKEQDRSYTAIWHRRIVLLERAFNAWRQCVLLEKAERLKPGLSSPSFGECGFKQDTSPPTTPGVTPPRKKRTLVPGVTGLRNLGNTCYMNSILQVLSHLKDFRHHFLNANKSNGQPRESTPKRTTSPSTRQYVRQTTIECFRQVVHKEEIKGGLNGGGTGNTSGAIRQLTNSTTNNHASLSHELYALFRVMWSGKWALVSPHAMLNAVWRMIPFFKGYAQQDAQEFLCELLDKVQNEQEKVLSSQGYTATAMPPPPLTPTLRQGGGEGQKIQDIIGKTFQGELVSQVTCLSCGNRTQTYEPFMDLSLEFPDRYQFQSSSFSLAKENCHLTEMLAKFTEVEKLDGAIYACEKCNRKRRQSSNKPQVYTEAEKRFMINKLPKVLRLHLKRFRWSGRNHREKILTHVEFDNILNVRNFSNPDQHQRFYNYQLSAVVVHHGRGFGSGHYTAYTYNEEADSWVLCNDARLELCSSLSEVMRCQAYILFYTQQQPGLFADLTFLEREEIEETVDEEITFNYRNSLNKSMNLKLEKRVAAGKHNDRHHLHPAKRRRTMSTNW